MTEALWKLDRARLDGRLAETSLEIPAGVTAVIGYSGAGKTSLLNLLVGFEKPDGGSVVANGKCFWVPQDEGLWPHLTVQQHLDVMGSANETMLTAFDLAGKEQAFPDALSEGERSRLAVARALLSDAPVLVMDEPLVHVDPTRAGKYWAAIRQYLAGRSLVFATHSPERVLGEAQRAICLKEGRVLYAGDVAELYWRPATAELAECLGDGNWLTTEEAQLWLGTGGARCYRPEQIEIVKAADGPVVVEAERFHGSVAEVDVRHEATGQRRRFWHRPAGNLLQAGERVFVRVALMLVLLMAACGKNDAPVLAVREVHSWMVPPDGRVMAQPRSVTVGLNDEVVALDKCGRVLVYNAQGQVIRQWAMPEISVGKAEGVCVLSDGRIVVCDTHYHRLVFFDGQGKVLKMVGRRGAGLGEFEYPVGITKDDKENLYVCEYGGNDRVQKFTRNGKFVQAFGSFGTKPGEFQRPSGIAWHAGKLYVADAINNRIQIFSDAGKFLGVLGPVALNMPYDIAPGKDAALYVIEYGAGRVTKLSLDGRVLGRYGSTGAGDGQFNTPWGITIDSQQRLRIADAGNRRIVELKL